jgi:hypothetical protein
MSTRHLLPAAAVVRDDVEAILAAKTPWEARVYAQRTLGSGPVVEAWYLAMFFLRRWSLEVADHARRKIVHSGENQNRERPNAGHSERTAGIANGLGRDSAFDRLVAEYIMHQAQGVSDAESISQDDDALVHATIEAHQWCVMFAAMDELSDRNSEDVRGVAMPESRRSLPVFCSAINKSKQRLSYVQRGYVQQSLRHYRCAKRALSWMPYCQGVPRHGIIDPLFVGFEDTMDIRELVERVVREFKGTNSVIAESVGAIVERLDIAVAQQGYEHFFDDMLVSAPHREAGLWGEHAHVNVIPGSGADKCAPLLLACACGGSKNGLKQLIPRVRQHLTKCEGVTRGVIVVTDEWKSGILSDSLEDLRIRVAQGKVQVVFLLAPQPGSALVHMPIELL